MDLIARPLSGRLDASTRSLRLIPLSRDERLDLESKSADLLEVDLISVLLRSTLDDAREDPVPYEDFPREVDALRVFGALVDLEWFRDDVARCRVSPERLRESLTAPERESYLFDRVLCARLFASPRRVLPKSPVRFAIELRTALRTKVRSTLLL